MPRRLAIRIKCCIATETALRFWHYQRAEGSAMTVMIEMPVLSDNQMGACTQDPDRWMTATDDQTKAVCRSCPRRWRCAKEACEMPGAQGLWAGIHIPKVAAGAPSRSSSC